MGPLGRALLNNMRWKAERAAGETNGAAGRGAWLATDVTGGGDTGRGEPANRAEWAVLYAWLHESDLKV